MSDNEQIVHRNIPLSSPCDKERLVELCELNGVQQAECKKKKIQMIYDVSEINLSTIEAQLRKAGLALRLTMLWRIKRAFYRYVDDNIRASRGNNAASCCSNPHDIYASRRHEK